MKQQIGASQLRKEDRRLLLGQGHFSDDLSFVDLAHSCVVRSPHAHARLRSLDVDFAKAMPGVRLVVTGADLLKSGIRAIPHATGHSKVGADVPLVNRDGTERIVVPQLPLPIGRVLYSGEAVAFIVADTPDQARDAAEAILIDWDDLASVVKSTEAIAPDAPQLWDHVKGNLPLDADIGDPVETSAAFARAAHRVSFKSTVQRVTGTHMEPRACVGEWDQATHRYTVHASHGIGVVQMRADIAASLGITPDEVRVLAPGDVGGNFGTRNATYPEFILVAFAARQIGRPVKYVAERRDALLSDFQGRDLDIDMELALDEKGKFLAMRSVNTSNIGAYTCSFVPLNKGAQLMTSVYRVPVAHVQCRAVLTNTPPTIPYRSAGRPEAIYAVERIIDIAARQLGIDRVTLRRRNLIPPSAQPYRNPFGLTYDNGHYAAVMDRALELIGWKDFEPRRRAAHRRGKCRGIGIANYIETTSGVPRERAKVTVMSDGSVDLIIGTQASGQGHETSFSQVAAEWLGVPFDSVHVRYGDTDFVLAGGGSHSGRSMRHASIVINEAARQIIDKARRIVAMLHQRPPGEIVFEGGLCRVKDGPEFDLFEVARLAAENRSLPEELRAPLYGECDRITPGHAFPFGAAACEVEIDPDTGALQIIRYVSVDDVGVAVNPMILHGQTHGGIAQGVGQALMEQCWYDAQDGQNFSATLMDYALPRAGDLPSFITDLSETPAASHPQGVRPGGEGGTTPALGLMINAIVDALWHLGVCHVEMPATPQAIWKAIQAAKHHPEGP